jgi:hypothetical protein
MARFSTYAEVLTPDHLQWQAYKSGVKKNPPGQALADVLERAGGAYEFQMEIPQEFRDKLHAVGELTGDEKLIETAGLSAVPISLEHLRGVDPQTRIVFGYKLDYTPEESERLGLGRQGAPDPKNTIVVNLNQANNIRIAGE